VKARIEFSVFTCDVEVLSAFLSIFQYADYRVFPCGAFTDPRSEGILQRRPM